MSSRALLCALSSGLVLALATAPSAVEAAKLKPKAVGRIVAIGGSKKLTANGTRLHKGEKLTLGEHLVVGKRLTATLQLVKPKGVGDRDLVDLRPAKGVKFHIKISHKGSKITVRISPVR